MNLTERLKNHVLMNANLYLMAFIIIFMSGNFLLIFQFNLLFIAMMFSIFMMFLGQMLLFTPYSVAYPLYLFSSFAVVCISILYWIAQRVPYSDFYVLLWAIVIVVLVAISLAVHLFTRKKTGTFPILPVISIFLFGLLLALGVSQTADVARDRMFPLTVAIYSIISIFCFNTSFRAMALNKKLGVNDINKYLRKTKEDLLKKYPSDDARAEIDLLIYYLNSSVNSFIEGDLQRSFMDAYKIAFDNKRKAFKTICILPESKEENGRFREIRDNLSHSHITKKNKGKEEPEKKEYIKKLDEAKKKLFHDTLDLLKIVRYDFIDTALKEEQTQLA